MHFDTKHPAQVSCCVNGRMGNSAIQTVCTKHNELEKYYCKTCDLSFKICLQCFEINHDGHEIVEEPIQENNESPQSAKSEQQVHVETFNSRDSEIVEPMMNTQYLENESRGEDETSALHCSTFKEEQFQAMEENHPAIHIQSAEPVVVVSSHDNDIDALLSGINESQQSAMDEVPKQVTMQVAGQETANDEAEKKRESALKIGSAMVPVVLGPSRVQTHFTSSDNTAKDPTGSALLSFDPSPPKVLLHTSKPIKKVKTTAPSSGGVSESSAIKGRGVAQHTSTAPAVSAASSAAAASDSAYKSDSDMSSATCPEPVMTTRRQTAAPSSFRTSSPQLVWWEYYAHLLHWGEAHGHYNVPAGTVVALEDGSRQDLGLWLRRQKSYLSSMVDEKYEALIQLAETGKLWGGDANDLHAAPEVEGSSCSSLAGGMVRPLGARETSTASKRKAASPSSAKRASSGVGQSRELRMLMDTEPAKKIKTEVRGTQYSSGSGGVSSSVLAGIGPNSTQRYIEGRAAPTAGAARGQSGSGGAKAAAMTPTLGSALQVHPSTRVTESDREGFHTAAEETSDSQQQHYRHYRRSDSGSHHHSHHRSHHHHSGSHIYTQHSEDEEQGHYHYVAFAYAASDMPLANEIQIGVGCVEYTPNYEGNEVLVLLKSVLIPVDKKLFLSGMFVSEEQLGDVVIDKEAIIAKHIKVKRVEGRDEDLFLLTERSQRKIRDTNIFHRLYDRK